MSSNPLNSSRPQNETLIRLKSVSKTYSSPTGPFLALKEVTAEIRQGEFVAVIGKSGAGKTTLVNMITGVDHLTSGEVTIGDTSIHAMNETRLAKWRGRNLGVVYQSFHLLPGLSLLDNVLLPMDLCGFYRPRQSRSRALDLLRSVGLEEHAHKLPSQVSGGQQQRVAIARALANDPPVIVADEPTGRLDSVTAESIFEILQGMTNQGKTIVMVTHDPGLMKRVSRTLLIQDGEVFENGIR